MRETSGQQSVQAARERLSAGGAEFLGLLTRLLRRPRRGDRRLPLIWLVRATDTVDTDTVATDTVATRAVAAGALATGSVAAGPVPTVTVATGTVDPMVMLRRFLGQGPRRRVPHATLDFAAQPSNFDIPMALRDLHRQLSLEAFGMARLRFQHYPLADWLMHQGLSYGIDADDSRSTLVGRLRDRRGRGAAGEAAPTGSDAVSLVTQVLLWLVRRVVPGAVFRMAVSGRVPVVGRQYRWFMRQQYLAPRQSVTFLGFAERLTAGWRDGEQPDQVNKLLLHAFLEDLRQAYRRRLWRPADWRRTAYPICCSTTSNPAPSATCWSGCSTTCATRPAATIRCWSSRSPGSRRPNCPSPIR
ncbi:hypothetical protein CLV64_112157 [Micromonospora phaseoli]|nr:hypothetical protein CLV64_112157 [Micromonospora phaseoli]GIJ77395.1 hypothetical protein Xph01_18270 [Micromonospora phaseoli]